MEQTIEKGNSNSGEKLRITWPLVRAPRYYQRVFVHGEDTSPISLANSSDMDSCYGEYYHLRTDRESTIDLSSQGEMAVMTQAVSNILFCPIHKKKKKKLIILE